MNDLPLGGKIAVITGAGRGIGKAIALRFAKEGADVALCARSRKELSEVNSIVGRLGCTCLTLSVDLADPTQVRSFCDRIIDKFGAVDLIVNNAGVYLERGTFENSDPELWWKTMEVNIRGPYLITYHLLAVMRRGGKIINLSSGKGYSAGANSNAYHVSKAALNMMTEGLANELWLRDIDVNTLVPGPTATATFDNLPPGQERPPEEILAQDRSSLPKGLPAWERVKHPDEVADFAFYLATRPVGGPTGQIYSLARRPL
ncbi:MAG: SDR family NAD(P)-dependent oxidoreductase [Rhodobacteraceae bacterium]|nr:SDR family NAD(P)-dependent oxidoreductase [Paracoccaceae bacterium]MCY4248841.1 SDR family NAD(P)-dependent oxidoreductase [Paracoccaceae bacterium]